MKSTPQVSIGMPVRNGETFLREALDCLLTQTFTDFELCISDNQSTDRTEEVCRSYADRDERIRYRRQAENLGAVGNFNYVFAHTRGEYFKWASCDDVCHPTFLARCVEALDDRPDAVWCHSDSDMIDVNGQSWLDHMPIDDEEVEIDHQGKRGWKGHPRSDFNHDRPSRRFAGVLMGTRWSVDSYGLFRRDALQKTGMLVNLYGSEKVLIGEVSMIGEMAWVPEMLFSQRVHSGASSYIDSADAQQEFIDARTSRRFISTRQALLKAHIGAVRHANLSIRERIVCYLVIIQYVFQISKWKRVLLTTLRGQSVGGGGKRIIESADNSENTP